MIKNLVLKHLNIELSEEQELQFSNYYELLTEYNKHTNLTAIINKEDVYIKHFLDSLYLSKSYDFLKENVNFCDMGSGAGFPSIPLKIVFPNIKVTIVDSLGKRITFLKQLVNKLNLKDVNLYHERAEVFAKENLLSFNVVTARALGKLPLILEMGVPMLKIGGSFLAMKSTNVLDELKSSKTAMATLGVNITNTFEYNLPLNEGLRYIYTINKEKHVKGYPRSFSIMKKRPL